MSPGTMSVYGSTDLERTMIDDVRLEQHDVLRGGLLRDLD